MTRVLLLGDISPTKMELEPSWAIALAERGFEVAYMVECEAGHRTSDGLFERVARAEYLPLASARRHLASRVAKMVPFARSWKPDVIVAFNPLNLMIAHGVSRTIRPRPWVHYHAHELFPGCGNVRVEGTEHLLAPRSQSVSVNDPTRGLILGATVRLGDLPAVVANFPNLVPDRVEPADPADGPILVADGARAFEARELVELAAGALERGLPEVVVAGRPAPDAPHLRPVGTLPIPDFIELISRSSIAVGIVPAGSWNQRLGTPYRFGLFLSWLVPQVVTDLDYTRLIPDATERVRMSPTMSDVLDAMEKLQANRQRARAAARAARDSWANMNTSIGAIQWVEDGP
jgi:hypothetical protein